MADVKDTQAKGNISVPTKLITTKRVFIGLGVVAFLFGGYLILTGKHKQFIKF